MKHLKHLKHRLATCVFHLSSSVRRSAKRGTAGSDQPMTEDGGGLAAASYAWPAMAPFLGRLAWARRRTGQGMARRAGDGGATGDGGEGALK